MDTDRTKQARDIFSHDTYASSLTGVVIEYAEDGYAKCSLKIKPSHLNAMGFVMGGAIFTLADFTFAVASNLGGAHTVSLGSNISFVSATKGPELFAESKRVKDGKNICFFEITVTDDEGKTVATVSTTGYKKLK